MVAPIEILDKDLIFQYKTILPGTLPECQTVWIQIMTDSVGPDLGPNCLQRLSADDKSRHLQEKS